MSLAAVAGPLSHLALRVCKFAVVRKASPPHSSATTSLFDHLQHVLRLATECPRGPAGDDIRRGVCEVVEAESIRARRAGRRRMRNAIAAVEWRLWFGRSRADDPGPVLLGRLSHALQGEIWNQTRPRPLSTATD